MLQIRTRRPRLTSQFLMLGTALLLSGCGQGDRPPIGTVSGTVTMDGEPFSGVIVSFMPESGRPATGISDDSGRYSLEYVQGVKGCKVGPAKVVFFAPTGGTMSHAIPPKYQAESELSADVKSGSNTFDFDLKSSPDGGPAKSAAKAAPVMAD